MSGLALLLVGVGLADLVRSLLTRDPVPDTAKGAKRTRLRRGRVLPGAVGAGAVLVLAAVCGLLTTAAGAGLIVLAAGSVAIWAVLADRALHARSSGHLLALTVLVGMLGAQVLLSGWAAPVGGLLADWLGWARLPWSPPPSAERVLLLAGLLLVQLSTGNVVVRLVLTSIGAMKPEGDPAPQSSDETQPSEALKGGRLLGPLERVFILGLGLAGQVAAAGMVIAAKGLIRWPELKAKSEERDETGGGSGIDAVTEYFLVGSFVSWLVALAALFVGSA